MGQLINPENAIQHCAFAAAGESGKGQLLEAALSVCLMCVSGGSGGWCNWLALKGF